MINMLDNEQDESQTTSTNNILMYFDKACKLGISTKFIIKSSRRKNYVACQKYTDILTKNVEQRMKISTTSS